MGVATAIGTALADVGDELLALLPVVLPIAAIPLVARVAWRFAKGFIR
jgi:hypothetical protein